jgi:hypothetical protein
MGRFLRMVVLVAATFFVIWPAHAALIPLSAVLDGAQEVPPNASPASGFGTMTYDDVTNIFVWHIEFAGLVAPEIAAHFHAPAPPGVNAAVVIPLPLGSPKDGFVDFDDQFGALAETREAELLSGLFYVNVHSQAFPGGEIRGQVLVAPLVVPEPSAFALLSLGLLVLALRRRCSLGA